MITLFIWIWLWNFAVVGSLFQFQTIFTEDYISYGMTNSSAFVTIQPLCVEAMKQPNETTLVALLHAVKTINKEDLQTLQEYILFPLRTVFKAKDVRHQAFQIELINGIGYILQKTRVDRWELFQDLFNTLCIFLENPFKKEDHSEEIKEAVVKCLSDLVKSGDSSVTESLFSVRSLPALGHAVTILLGVIEKEKSRSLKNSSMECLITLSHADSKCNAQKKFQYGNTFASFLPGISMALTNVVSGDMKQGQSVIVNSIETWKKIVGLVMEDKYLKLEEKSEGANGISGVEERLVNLVVRRNSKWVEQTSDKLSVLIKKISTLRNHSSWKVRLAMVSWAEFFITKCSKSMSSSLPVFFEVLVILLNDEYETISHKCMKILQEAMARDTTDNSQSLLEMLEDNLHNLASSMPRTIRMADEQEKLATVNLLCGYITVLVPKITNLLHSWAHIRRLSLSLVQVLELDCSDIKIVEDRRQPHLGDGDIQSMMQVSAVIPRKTFIHFQDEKISKVLYHVCRLLGHYGDLNMIVDNFVDIFHESSSYRIQATLIINEIIYGAAMSSDDLKISWDVKCGNQKHVLSIVKMMIEEYLLPNNFNITNSDTSLSEKNQNNELRIQRFDGGPSLSVINRNIIQTCLFIEGIGVFSKAVIGDFEPMLITVLYPVMEKLGSDNFYISSTAYYCLLNICQSCSYSSLDALIKMNSDYLINSTSLRLRHFFDNKQAPLVVKVILQYSGVDILPIIEDTIEEVLSSLDDYYRDEASLFADVLHQLTISILKWFPRTNEEATPSTLTSQSKDRTSDNAEHRLCTFFREYHKLKQTAKGVSDCEDLENDDLPPTDQEDNLGFPQEEEIKKPPKHVEMVKKVLQRLKHLLSSANPRLRLKLLDIVSVSCKVLVPYQNELLPMLHEIWQPFAHRFYDEEKNVIITAMKTLQVMSECAHDFLRHRVVKDVFPLVMSFLKNQQLISCQAGPAYQYTLNFKLQLSILETIGSIASNIKCNGKEIDSIAESSLCYLSARQPPRLQKAACTMFESLVQLKPDALWLTLNDLYCPHAYNKPADCFTDIEFLSDGKRNEYTDSVTKLLQLYDNHKECEPDAT